MKDNNLARIFFKQNHSVLHTEQNAQLLLKGDSLPKSAFRCNKPLRLSELSRAEIITKDQALGRAQCIVENFDGVKVIASVSWIRSYLWAPSPLTPTANVLAAWFNLFIGSMRLSLLSPQLLCSRIYCGIAYSVSNIAVFYRQYNKRSTKILTLNSTELPSWARNIPRLTVFCLA